MSVLTINVPNMLTKKLKLQSFGGEKKKLVVSTNWLPLFGFEKDARVVEKVIGAGKGMKVLLATDEDVKTKKVYQREYKSRRNNPLETQLDIRNQSKLAEALGDCEQVHITFKQGEITILPISTKQSKRIQRAKDSVDLLSAFMCCSSGVDCQSMVDNNFRLDALLEYRPDEKRDKRSMSETGALCAMNNFAFDTVFNEDIFEIDTKLISDLVNKSKTALFSISTQCDDFSNVKAKGTKEKQCNTDNVNDMIFDALRIIEAGQFPFVLLENVPGYLKSEYHSLFETRLERWGYKVYSKVVDAYMVGGVSRRKRAYVFATTFTGVDFSFPEEREPAATEFWKNDVLPFLPECRDVSHCKSIQDGATGGRLRVVNQESKYYPTLLKSQSRQAKDSLVVEHQGRYFFPSERMERHIMGIPEKFSLEAVSKTIGSEIVGQAVELVSHSRIINSIKEHISRVGNTFSPKGQLTLSF